MHFTLSRLGLLLIRYVLSKLRRTKGAFAFIAITTIGIALSYAAPYVNGKFLDFLLANRSERDAVLFALLVASIGIFSALFSYFAGTLSIRITTRLSFNLLRETVLRFERVNFLASKTTDSAYTTQRIFTDSNVVSSFVLTNFISAPLSVAAIPFVLLVIWSVDPILALFSVALLAVYLCVITGLRKLLYRVMYEKKEADSAFYAVIASQLNQILNIQLTSSYGRSEQALDAGFEQYFPKVLRSGKISFSLTSLDGLFAAIFQAIILIISGVRIINGTMTIGEYTIVGAYFAVLFKTLKSMMSLFKSYQDAKASWDRMSAIGGKELKPKHGQASLAKIDKIDSISVSELNFAVPLPDGSLRRVLDGFSFSFSGPGTYCIVGENGRGKTSLLYLLLGLYPSAGKVVYNDTSIEKCDLDYIRSGTISCCPQPCFAPDETVQDLLNYFNTPFSAKQEHMNELPTLTNGVEDLLEKRCPELSGGELRRVYLWSSISRKSSVLMLDEPTTGLDAASRSELASYVRNNKLKQLIIIVSHDDELADASETIIDLDDMSRHRAAR